MAGTMAGGVDTGAAERKEVLPVSFLCADCGAEVRMDCLSPALGLCESCEERLQQRSLSTELRSKSG